jgi:hypothetical protein
MNAINPALINGIMNNKKKPFIDEETSEMMGITP